MDNALSSCTVSGLAKDDGQKIIDQMKKQFVSAWEEVYLRHNVPKKDLPALQEAFVNHLR